jgi:hypothetical protein
MINRVSKDFEVMFKLVKSGRTQKACPLVYHSINLVDWMLPNPPIATNQYGNNHIVEG